MSDQIGLLRADLLWEGVVKASDVPVRSVRVNINGSAPTRRTLAIELEAAPSIVPKNSSSSVAPYGAEVAIHGGWWEGGDRLYPGGVFRIDETRLRKSPDERAIFLEAPDRSASVESAGFRRVTTLQPGADIVGRIVDMCNDALPGLETNFEEATYLAPRLLVWEPGDSLWKACRELAASVGMELFFDAAGVLVLRKVPSIVSTRPVVDYRVGTDYVTSIERSWSARQGYNFYTVIGQSDSLVPVRGEAYDKDRGSATYYGGPFGRRHAPPIHDPAVGSAYQATIAAQGHLNRDRGGTEQVELSTQIDWRRDAGDVARLADAEWGLRESAVLEQVTLSRTKDTAQMSVTTAAKRTVVEESEADDRSTA